MNPSDSLEKLKNALRPGSAFFRQPRPMRYLDFVFGDIPLENARVLDIGGGEGLFSFAAVAKGAASVVCLEPEEDGGHGEMQASFSRLKPQLDPQDRVEWHSLALLDYQPDGPPFDLILLHNSVNHLDEEACIQLRTSQVARQRYREIFDRIHGLAAAEASIILCDCSSRNFFARMGLYNRFAPTIEWYKHQPPSTWVQLLRESGFGRARLTWTFCPRLGGTLGALVTYFLDSHFRIEMKRI